MTCRVLRAVSVTDVLPVLDVVSDDAASSVLQPEDFEDIAYSSSYLLPVSFPCAIVGDAEYVRGCELGFVLYFDWPELWGGTFSELKKSVIGDLFSKAPDAGSLASRVGFQHGLLSALALTNRSLALAGLSLLVRLTEYLVFLSEGRV